MNTAELLSLLALQYKQGISDALAKKLIVHFKEATRVTQTQANELKELDWFPQHLLADWNWSEAMEASKIELEYLQNHNIKCLAFYQDDYPRRLQHCVDGPLLLFYKGSPPWNKKRWISIVGNRCMTTYGQQQCEEIVRKLKPYDPVIVSGLALGVDVTAHRAALEAGLSTVACMAQGLDWVYPRRHAGVAAQIVEQGGLISETWTGGEFHNKYFIRRNRIIAGLSEATIVVESAKKGGSLTTADMAFSYDRLVYAVPGRLTDPQSVGCNNLIEKQLAQVYTSSDKIAADLGWDTDHSADQLQLPLIIQQELNADELVVYNQLSKLESKHIEVLLKELPGLGHKIPAILLSLELKGWVSALPGQLFKCS